MGKKKEKKKARVFHLAWEKKKKKKTKNKLVNDR